MLVSFWRVVLAAPLAADVKGVRMHSVERMVSLYLNAYCYLQPSFILFPLIVVFSIHHIVWALYLYVLSFFFIWNSGSAPLGTEAEQEEETEACENSTVEKALQKSEIQNNEEQNPSSALAITPLRLSRFDFKPFVG